MAQPLSVDVYDARIKALARDAHGEGRLERVHAGATRDNPLCGDRVEVDLEIDEASIVALRWRARGCLLCRASASMLGLRAAGLPAARIGELRDALADCLAGTPRTLPDWPELDAFSPVAKHRSRHGCVTLAIDAALAALLDAGAIEQG